MNVELTLQHMFDNYPGLFKERADCYNQLFCTIGNGYHWEDGELIANQEYNKNLNSLTAHLVDGKAFQHNKLSLRAEARYYAEFRKNHNMDNYSDSMKSYLKSIEEEYFNSIPDDIYYKKPRKYRWSFYIDIPGYETINYHKDFAYLFNYPDNIKPDWLEAIEDCKKMLREDGFII